MKRHNIILSTIIGLLALMGLSYGSYRGYSAYKADPKGFNRTDAPLRRGRGGRL